MEFQEAIEALERSGAEQTRKTYRRHGISDPMFGVSYAVLGALRKRIKIDHPLALQLWECGNHDARVLASMIADPQQLDEATIARWSGDLRNQVLADALAGLVAHTPQALRYAEQWTIADDEWIERAGWSLVGQLAQHHRSVPDPAFEHYLARIERDIHQQKNRVREAMNTALIAIGGRSDALEPRALAIAAAIGPVQVDHGATNCKTPDATSYIRKVRDHQQQQAAKASAKR